MLTCRGTEDVKAPHGVPIDLLDRLLIVRTIPYTIDEIKIILRSRVKIEGLAIADEALDALSTKGDSTSLRYAIQLLTPASILSKIAGREEITGEDVTECEGLFLDAKRSASVVQQSGRYLH